MTTFKVRESSLCESYNSSQLQIIKKKYWQRKGLLECEKERDFAKCVPLSPCPKKILLECGPVGGQSIFLTTGDTADVAILTVDTACFVKPLIELQFSSQVSADLAPVTGSTLSLTVDLKFDLICKRTGGSELCLGSWSFRRVVGPGSTIPVETTDTFSFNRCLCPTSCTGCTDYFVRVTAINISTDNTASASVSTGQLIAKIQDC